MSSHNLITTITTTSFVFIIILTTFLTPSLQSSCLNPNNNNSSSSSSSRLILSDTTIIYSQNKTFALGFFNTNNPSKWYLGIWYASIPTPTYIWVANRQTPLSSRQSSSLFLTNGKLTVTESTQDPSCDVVWQTPDVNFTGQADVELLEDGDLVVKNLDGKTTSFGSVLWRSFDYPTDTFLPGMNLTVGQTLTCWKNDNDPGLGKYSLRLRPPDYGEVELLYIDNDNVSISYWSSGNWTGNIFAGVPEMTLPYIYKFYFTNPFSEMATFGFYEVWTQKQKPLTRFSIGSTGQIKQYTWSVQTEFWNMFWSQPENPCRVYGLCGNLGFCDGKKVVSPCKCLDGFRSLDDGDFTGGCVRDGGGECGEGDEFEEIGEVTFDRQRVDGFSGSRGECESKCLRDCECVGLSFNVKTSYCKNYFGTVLNLGNSSSGLGMVQDLLSVRVRRGVGRRTIGVRMVVLVSVGSFLLAVLLIGSAVLVIVRKRKVRRKKLEEESVFPVTNLSVFTYKELHAATNGFSDQLGHGGFGAVFSGNVDSTLVAVKRLDRPGGGEKEFRAEVCTIGNIQHVNLVRLRGFCSEESHRLLVYDYMPNGPLSSYLKTGGRNLDWDARFRIAIGTARGIAYLHEECRNCIIHCDIKPENILLDQDFSAKVSDFGLAKLIGRDFSRVLATMRGTWGYVAPEWISGVAITTKADVYSYGMTLLELLGGRRNVEGPPDGGNGGESNEKWFFPPWAAKRITEGDVASVVDERLGGEYNMEEVVRVGLVAVWCIQDEEATRPTMGMVVKMLEGVVAVEVPPPPKLLQALVSGESFHGVGGNSRNDTFSRVSVDSKDSQFAV